MTVIALSRKGPPSRVSDLNIQHVSYNSLDGMCAGSNLTYKVDGEPSCSRVPWVAVSPQEETARIERLLIQTDKKRMLNA